MTIKYYAKQINPEYQEDDLFYSYKDKQGHYQVGINDEFYVDNLIITGNKEYHSFTTKAYDKVMRIEETYYEYEPLTYKGSNKCYWTSLTEYIEWYCPKDNGKKYSTKEIHQWKLLLEKYSNHWDIEDIMCDALALITGKTWRSFTIRGICQRDWQEGYASDEVSKEGLAYVEMCYFNTGSQYMVYESEDDFNNDGDCYSMYVDSYNSKHYMAELLGCEEDEIEMYDFDGYIKTPQYKRV